MCTATCAYPVPWQHPVAATSRLSQCHDRFRGVACHAGCSSSKVVRAARACPVARLNMNAAQPVLAGTLASKANRPRREVRKPTATLPVSGLSRSHQHLRRLYSTGARCAREARRWALRVERESRKQHWRCRLRWVLLTCHYTLHQWRRHAAGDQQHLAEHCNLNGPGCSRVHLYYRSRSSQSTPHHNRRIVPHTHTHTNRIFWT